jgi:hypothetical protein
VRALTSYTFSKTYHIVAATRAQHVEFFGNAECSSAGARVLFVILSAINHHHPSWTKRRSMLPWTLAIWSVCVNSSPRLDWASLSRMTLSTICFYEKQKFVTTLFLIHTLSVCLREHERQAHSRVQEWHPFSIVPRGFTGSLTSIEVHGQQFSRHFGIHQLHTPGCPLLYRAARTPGIRSLSVEVRREMCLFLVEKGADPNQLDANGRASLFLAVFANNAAAALLLLECGANPSSNRAYVRLPLRLQFAKEMRFLSLLCFRVVLHWTRTTASWRSICFALINKRETQNYPFAAP